MSAAKASVTALRQLADAFAKIGASQRLRIVAAFQNRNTSNGRTNGEPE